MEECLKLKTSNCRNCYKCIRSCPVKSIKFSNNQAHIISKECILCGKCFVVCPQGAKEIRNDIAVVKNLIASSRPVVVSLAPSFVANYEGKTIKAMEKALMKLGFASAEETAAGAAVVAKEYDELVKEKSNDVIISSCCHTVNLLIQKHYPQALPYIAQVDSPMLAHAKIIKERQPNAYVVFIGPCISKKDEIVKYPNIVDAVLTFEELTSWFKMENIEILDDIDSSEKLTARFFPTSGGVLKTMKKESNEYTYLTVDGIGNCKAALQDIIDGNLKNCFIEMSACNGSCINGPAMDVNCRLPVTRYVSINKYAGSDDATCSLSRENLKKNIAYLGINESLPSEDEIKQILKSMGKISKLDELNCGSCGYNTCREKAIAVYQGKASVSMCLPFLKEKAESFSDNIISYTPNGIIVVDEDLKIQLVNEAACKIINLQSPDFCIGEHIVKILNPKPFVEVLYDGGKVKNQHVYLAEYKKYVEITVAHDKNFHILICIMRDITQEEKEKSKKDAISQQTIEVTDKVIDKQMRIVQEIASLLGETAAETKVALTKLKESLKDE